VREHLQAAALASGRSISEEIEHRLQESFTKDRLIAAFLGGGDTAQALRLIAELMQNESAPERSWKDDPDSAEVVRSATNLIIAQLANLPEALPRLLDGEQRRAAQEAGQRLVADDARTAAFWLIDKVKRQNAQRSRHQKIEEGDK
jgi:hypothetical protein